MRRIAGTLLACLFLSSAMDGAGRGAPSKTSLSDCQKALHVLNRLGFGPRPGDVDRVLSVGISAYLEAQLHPEVAGEDPLVLQRLEELSTTRMSDAELILAFERPIQNARKVAEKEVPDSGDSGSAAREREQLVNELVPAVSRPPRILDELTRARVLRAVYSDAQLNEVLVDFWMNHFNVFAGKDAGRAMLPTFEREVIRPHVWGCFRDLLLATARSPAMLSYLDNTQSVAAAENRFGAPDLPPIPFAGKARPGLNENYARELLELHTMGVDGGYSQGDVTELARVLTGWSVAPPEEGGGFLFRFAVHDVCPKTILGRRLTEGRGIDEGEEMIGLLAGHPATARHISWKLCQRLIRDDPPGDLVDRAAAVFLSTDGDLRQVVRAIVTSPEFFAPSTYRAKVKTPFEYVVSSIRAVAASTDGGGSVAQQIARQGEPLYLCPPPTGFGDSARDWINTGSLLARWNFALDLAGGRVGNARIDFERLLTPSARRNANEAFSVLEQALFAGDLSSETRGAVRECVLETEPGGTGGADPRIPPLLALLLASPEFQRH